MIFVTVGTWDFNQLVKKIDRLAPFLENEVVVQIGYGSYIPKNCEYFRFASSLAPYYDEADIIIAHGGAGTTIEVLKKGKKLISVDNKTLIDSHQSDILETFASAGHLVWCQDLDELPLLLKSVPTMDLKPYVTPPCTIGEVIKEYLSRFERRGAGYAGNNL